MNERKVKVPNNLSTPVYFRKGYELKDAGRGMGREYHPREMEDP